MHVWCSSHHMLCVQCSSSHSSAHPRGNAQDEVRSIGAPMRVTADSTAGAYCLYCWAKYPAQVLMMFLSQHAYMTAAFDLLLSSSCLHRSHGVPAEALAGNVYGRLHAKMQVCTYCHMHISFEPSPSSAAIFAQHHASALLSSQKTHSAEQIRTGIGV